MFEPLTFTKLNETDVREEILTPIIRFLNYRSGTINNVIREQPLKYPYSSLGRKQPRKDPILRGKADYILEVENKIRWVIEAKSPNVSIDTDAIEQAYTYANHPEIRAIYFVISNGKKFKIYKTNNGPDQKPILELKYEELNDSLNILKNILSPSSILRDFPDIKVDIKKPLGEGLRSVVRITNGTIKYTKNSLNLKLINEMQTSIEYGAIERNKKNEMIIFLKIKGPTQSFEKLNERLGISSFELVSFEEVLSSNISSPTIFTYKKSIILPKGEILLDISSLKEVKLSDNIYSNVNVEIRGILNKNKFMGEFITMISYSGINFRMIGNFEIFLS